MWEPGEEPTNEEGDAVVGDTVADEEAGDTVGETVVGEAVGDDMGDAEAPVNAAPPRPQPQAVDQFGTPVKQPAVPDRAAVDDDEQEAVLETPSHTNTAASPFSSPERSDRRTRAASAAGPVWSGQWVRCWLYYRVWVSVPLSSHM
jgi:hypothetical protein